MKHPAKYSDSVLDTISDVLDTHHFKGAILDPFAGAGRVHELGSPTRQTYGVELEPEWAHMHPKTIVGDALNLPSSWKEQFDAIVTSPCYGNRMADHHDAKDASSRNTYTHVLGRPLTDGNAGALQWGTEYRHFHIDAWRSAWQVLKPEGLFVLNISDHIRKGKRQQVAAFHVNALCNVGLNFLDVVPVATPRQRHGANRDARVDAELVIAFVKPRFA